MAHIADALETELKDAKLRELETKTSLDQRYVFYLTRPMKLALAEIARSRHLTMADVVRQALPSGLKDIYPEFESIYLKHLKTET